MNGIARKKKKKEDTLCALRVRETKERKTPTASQKF